MGDSSRKLNIVLSSSVSFLRTELLHLLPGLHLSAQIAVFESDEIEKSIADIPVDAILFGSEEFDQACELAGRSYASILILCDKDAVANLWPSCITNGILLGELRDLPILLPQLLAVSTRFRSMRHRANTLRRKLDDSRLVNRAKLLLMSHLQMSEEEAHRYIEKTAMDSGSKSREIALGIIRTYEE